MKSAHVVGKRIAKIEQTRCWNENGGYFWWDLEAIVLEDGTRIGVMTIETEGEYGHEAVVSRPTRRSR
jgi:hypothetical protein